MPYKTKITKKCSECGNVLETATEHFCDGCGKDITTLPEDYDNQIRLGFLAFDHETHIPEMVFHSLDCFLENHNKINLEPVGHISIEFMSPTLYNNLMSKLLGANNHKEGK